MANFFKRSSTASLSFEHSDSNIGKDQLDELFTDLQPDDQTETIRINLNELPDPPMNILVAIGHFSANYTEKVSIDTILHPQTAEKVKALDLDWFEYQEAENG